jgi:hypothetical protein
MGSQIRKSGRSLINEELPASVPKSLDGRLLEMAEIFMLRDIPVEERRKEAKKPLFLYR